MSPDKLKKVISDCCNDVTFEYNGKKSGITSEVKDYIPTFQAWHGDQVKEYSNVDILMSDRFYSGKSLRQLAKENIEFWIL